MDCYTSLENVAFIHLLLHGSKTTCPTALCPFESAVPHPTPSQSLQEFHKVLTWGQYCSSTLLMTYPVQFHQEPVCMQTTPSSMKSRSIDHTTQWAACWHGKFSSCKTELLLVGRQTSADDQVSISIYSSVITECSSHKHLGVTISYNLNWSAHVTQLIKKASRRCGLLRCLSHHLPPIISSLLYIYHVRPIFEYASPLWHGAISAELALSLESCKLVLPERSCGHQGEHQSNNFWKLLTGPPFAGDVPLQALVFSNSLSIHQTLYHHSLSTFSPFFLPAPPATDANHSR